MPNVPAKINTLHIVTQLELGGAQKNCLAILENLDNEKYNKYLATSLSGPLMEDAREIPQLNLLLLPFLKRRISPLADLVTLVSLTRQIKRLGIQIVHTHSSKAGILGRWAARLAGVPVITHTVHGWPFHDYQNPLLKKFYIFMERATAKITDKLIVVSEQDRQVGLKNRIGKNSAYQLIRYGIDINEFTTSNNSASSLGLRNGASVVAMVACFKPQKNPLDFIRAAREILSVHPNAKFVLIGDGALRKKVESAIKENNLQDKIRLLGWRRDINRILSEADIVVQTSLWEGLPIVFLESMASGLPVVAYDVGGAAEVIKNGINGFLVKPKDVRGLSEKVMQLLRDKELQKVTGVADAIFCHRSLFLAVVKSKEGAIKLAELTLSV